jgi:hypothetical protein
MQEDGQLLFNSIYPKQPFGPTTGADLTGVAVSTYHYSTSLSV